MPGRDIPPRFCFSLHQGNNSMAWRIAESLETLRKQLNEAFPRRSKASDGGIGDAKHASRSSDHNPYIKNKGIGIVTARDFTHDPKTGIDCNWLADMLVKNKDSRIKYIIWNKRICSSKTSPWQWRPYSGVNGHTKHLHLSVIGESKFYDSTKEWDLDFPDDESTDIATVSAQTHPTSPVVSTAKDELLGSNTPTAPTTGGNLQVEPAPSIEVKQTSEEKTATGVETTEVTTTNQQDVNVPAQVATSQYQGVGLFGVLKKDFAVVTGGNLSFQGIQEYATQASGWPPWVISIITKLATVAIIAGAVWLVYRLIHYIIWKVGEISWSNTEAHIKSDVTRKDIERL